jgi:hypothetical protein
MNRGIVVRKLGAGDGLVAKHLFAMMAQAFGEQAEELSGAHVDALLSDGRFWVVAALAGRRTCA